MYQALFWVPGHFGEQNKVPTPWSAELGTQRPRIKAHRRAPGGPSPEPTALHLCPLLTSLILWSLRSEQLNRNNQFKWEASSWSRCRNGAWSHSRWPDGVGRNRKAERTMPDTLESQEACAMSRLWGRGPQKLKDLGRLL